MSEPLRSLVVEDDPAMQRLLEALLAARGHRVRTAGTGGDALAAFESEPADLVVLDLVLPDIDGLDVCRRIRTSPGGAGVAILVCTRRKGDEDLRAVLDAGADDYIAKPLQVALVNVRLAVVEEQIARRAAARRPGMLETIAFLPGEPPEPPPVPTEKAPAPAAPAAPAADEWRYDLESRIAQGGAGDVYRARDRELDDVVAIKLIRAEESLDGTAVDRARQEVRLARRVANPHVARVFDVGWREGQIYVAMEFVPGVTLAQYIRTRGRLEPARAVELGAQILDGLHAAHELGIVHRDLKPSNVMITPEGRAVILDFGIALRPDQQRLTMVGAMIGTPAYMSPEQIRGEEITPRTDVYAFGCLLYEALAGEPPYAGSDPMQTIARQLTEACPPLDEVCPGLTPGLSKLVARCLEKSAAARFADAGSVRAALLATTAPRSTTSTTPATGKAHPARCIHVFDADPEGRQTLAGILESLGHAVQQFDVLPDAVRTTLEAGAGALFLAAAKGESVSVMEAVQMLRSFPKTRALPIIVTSRGDEGRKMASLLQGSAFLAQPFVRSKVEACLAKLLPKTDP